MKRPEPDRNEVLPSWLASRPYEWRKALLRAPFSAGVQVAGIAIADSFLNRLDACTYASYIKIGAACGMQERGVRSAVATMVAAEYLTKRKTRFGGTN